MHLSKLFLVVLVATKASVAATDYELQQQQRITWPIDLSCHRVKFALLMHRP
jgi:hypothetical protein